MAPLPDSNRKLTDAEPQTHKVDKRLHKSPDTVIVGAGGSLDSLGIVTFVILLEEKVGEAFGTTVQLLDEQMLVEDSPFQSIGALTHYIATRAM